MNKLSKQKKKHLNAHTHKHTRATWLKDPLASPYWEALSNQSMPIRWRNRCKRNWFHASDIRDRLSSKQSPRCWHYRQVLGYQIHDDPQTKNEHHAFGTIVPHVLEPLFVSCWLKRSNKAKNNAFETKKQSRGSLTKMWPKTTWEFIKIADSWGSPRETGIQ